jgi:3-dehydroquinate synthase
MAYFTRKKFGNITRMDLDVGIAEYPVFVGDNPTSMFASYVVSSAKPHTVVIVADENIAQDLGVRYETAFISQGVKVVALTVPAGEACKSWKVAGELIEALADARIARDDVVVALGGGAVSDLVGFVAHVYLRGIGFAVISTTLLSMVDACVGGKAAVDLQAGKNLAGALQQPIAVMADIGCLERLPDEEFQSGLAEVAKTAFLEGDEFTTWCEQHVDAINDRDKAVLTDLILACMEFKAIVVASDPYDQGARECLNYGHTLGHAIEHEAGYGTITHGRAIAEGIRFASRVSVQVSGAPVEAVLRQDRLLDAFNVSPITQRWAPVKLLEAMQSDKKIRGGKIRMVLMEDIGQWEVTELDNELVLEHLRAWEASAV